MNTNDFERSVFPLGEAFDYGYRIWPEINDSMIGVGCGSAWNMGILAQAVFNVGDRDYLEIGNHFGGSLILAGLIKRFFGLGGQLIGVDPYDESWPFRYEIGTGVEATPEVLRENLKRFDLEFIQLQEFSNAVDWFWVESNTRILEGAIYVDGDHSPAGFAYDIEQAVDLGPRYIVVDNVDTEYPHLVRGVTVWAYESNYRLVHLSGMTAVLERKNIVT